MYIYFSYIQDGNFNEIGWYRNEIDVEKNIKIYRFYRKSDRILFIKDYIYKNIVLNRIIICNFAKKMFLSKLCFQNVIKGLIILYSTNVRKWNTNNVNVTCRSEIEK